MHKKLLLLELKGFGRHFAIGYYDAVKDIFCTWSGFMHTDSYSYEEMNLDGTGLFCILPPSFVQHKGSRLLKGYIPLKDAVIKVHEEKRRIEDIDEYLDSRFCGYCVPHLLCTRDGRVIVSGTSCFCESGNQFEVFTPSEINGHIYHSGSPVPREDIHYVVDLTKLDYVQNPVRMADADRLFDAIRKNDLEYMQQGDVMVCIKDTIERYFGNICWDHKELEASMAAEQEKKNL